ncbi:MAG: 1-acyl-sn-glycerol-3-phosphate acyltransferase [Oscillospiraceae bacterium]|nr:1-acyl-sn-glycerol-3-phosphate acyltransferase [Oscillospiraceae bacterium]
MSKIKRWTRPRHRLARNVLEPLMASWAWLIYGCKPKPFRAEGDRAYLILFNHQTMFDQFFIGLSFKDPVYFLGTEDLFSMGLISSLMRFFLAPIPYRKQTSDVAALRNCMRIAREGGNIAIAPEGNMTYSGKTETIRTSIAGLAKALKLPIALYRIEGGFGVQPRWGNTARKGKVRAFVSQVIEHKEYKNLSDGELYEIIRDGLNVNDCQEGKGRYRSPKRAEYLERSAYYCPWCGLSSFHSEGNMITCVKCGRTVEYGEDLQLRGVGCDFPYRWYTDWYDAQENYIRAIDLSKYLEIPAYRETVDMYEVILYKRKYLLRRKTELALYGDRMVLDEGKKNELTLPFGELAGTALQMRNKLNLNTKDGAVYQIRGNRRFNPAKYINFYYHYLYISGDTEQGDYLGF